MSIKPPSDLLLDVARAADPAKSSAAAEKLARIAGNSGAGDEGFAEVLDGVGASPPPPSPPPQPTPPAPPAASAPQQPGASAIKLAKLDTAPTDGEVKAYRGIEALVLQNLIETMLPESDEFFGAQAGASIWKSMLAEELGTALSKRVDLGIGPKHVGREIRAREQGELGASLAPVGEVGSKHS